VRTTEELMILLGYEFSSKEIGSGGFGRVKKVLRRSDGKVMACKEIAINKSKREKAVNSLKNEIAILKRAQNKYIIHMYDSFIVEDRDRMTAYIFLEFADSTLDTNIKYGIDIETAKRYFAQIATALISLHKKGIAHKDLKPENILLVTNEKTNEVEVRVTDFGLSQKVFIKSEGIIKTGHFGGTRAYMAPEIIDQEVHKDLRKSRAYNYDPMKADIWALGICLYEILPKQVPFDSSNLSVMLENQKSRLYTLPKHIDPMAADLLTQLLTPEPKDRLDPFGILTHPWIGDKSYYYLPLIHSNQ